MHLRPLLVAAFLFGHAACALAQSGQRLEIPDANGYERPMTAFTVDVPAGWQGSGGVFWDVGNPCSAVVPSMNWQARSPDGQQAFEILPRWVSQSVSQGMPPTLPGCPVQAIESIRGYLEMVARQRRPNGRILDYRDRPDLARTIQVADVSTLDNEMMQNRTWVESGEILVGWQENGRTMREAILAAVSLNELRMDMPLVGATRSVTLSALATTALRAPDGQLDVSLATRILSSLQTNPQWAGRMQQHGAQLAQTNMRGTMERSRIVANTNTEIAQMRNDAWWDGQRRQDNAHRNFIHSINGTQPYHDPYSGGSVDLSNQYNYAWRLNDGSYYQSNDPSFDPYTQLGIDGQPIQPMRYE